MKNKEAEYFKDRLDLEVKHFIEVWQWIEEFKPKYVLLLGCGSGQRVFTFNFYRIDAWGCDISKYAIENTKHKAIQNKLKVCDITKEIPFIEKDLVIAYDILEHISEDEIGNVLDRIYQCGTKNFLFSIPFLGNEDLMRDNTHKIFKDKKWWLDKLKEHKFKIQKTPIHFLYKEQMVVATK